MDEFGSSGELGMSEPVDGDIYEDWSDIDTSHLVSDEDGAAPEADEAEADEADQPENADGAEPEGEDKPEDEKAEEKGEEQKESDQAFELKHLDETRTVNREEVIALAQKGMDYDRIRGKLEELRGLEAQASQNESYAEFVKELAEGAGISVEEMIDSTRARLLVDRAAKQGQTLAMKDAVAQAKQTREAKAQSEQQSRELREARNKQERFREEAARFRTLHPDVKAEDIPPEVWEDYDRNGNLADAWHKHQNDQLRTENESLRKELETLKQEKKNEARSTGSRKTAGAGQKSAVDDAWNEALKSSW
ncbi:MAG: hypothetical protein J6Y20_03580 [Lachnospiraceae bacterium]|nr:hypothetical protein [Lachnospiraceae bacterium]